MSDDVRTQRYRTTDVQSDAGSFNDLLLPKHLVQALAAAGFERPSPVQKAAIPIGRVGTDVIVQAKSGTGKTAVFAAVLLERVSLDVAMPQAVVLAPTRELAIQSYQVVQRIASGLPDAQQPSAAVFVGGLPTAEDEKKLRRVCHIMVGTPGRLCALATSGALVLSKITHVVLDEADQLMGSSFLEDVQWLVKQLPKRKQVLAFSATYTPELMKALEPIMRRPQKVLLCEETVSLLGIKQYYKLIGSSSSSSSGVPAAVAAAAAAAMVGSSEPAASEEAEGILGASSAAESAPVVDDQQQQRQQQQQLGVQQALALKVEALLQLLSSVSFHQAVVFCNKKPAAEWLSRRLTAAGCPATYLSADLPQTQRMSAMEAVIGFKVRVIVSTDVMARGVDFDRVNLVVNLDLPVDAATYVHRVGRTGRFGSRGVAIAFVTERELALLQQYLRDVRGGVISPLPDSVPDDFHTFQLESDWEQQALDKLLAAPVATPPSSPPPTNKQQKQQQKLGQAAAAAAADEAEPFWATSRATWQQQQQLLQLAAASSSADLGVISSRHTHHDGGDDHDNDGDDLDHDGDQAAAWDAWAEYYRSCGYSYPYQNPYREQTTATTAHTNGVMQQQQQQQQQSSWRQLPWQNLDLPQLQQQQQQQPAGASQQQQQQQQQSLEQVQQQVPVQCTGQHLAPNTAVVADKFLQATEPQRHNLSTSGYLPGDSSHTASNGAHAGGQSRSSSSNAASRGLTCEDETEGAKGNPISDDDGVDYDHDDGDDDLDDDDLDPRAALLLSRLKVADVAGPPGDDLEDEQPGSKIQTHQVTGAAPGSNFAGEQQVGPAGFEPVVQLTGQHDSYKGQQQARQQQQQQLHYVHASPGLGVAAVDQAAPSTATQAVLIHPHDGAVCYSCWASACAAWRRDYEAWRQQYMAWYGC